MNFQFTGGEYLAIQVHENKILQEMIEKLQTEIVKDEKAGSQWGRSFLAL